MNKTFKIPPPLYRQSNLESQTIDWLRLPLAIAVVFIHSYGSWPLDLEQIHTEPLTWQSAFNYIRICFSNVACSFAVPTFYMVSGYLFFYKIEAFNHTVYIQKLRKRVRSLLVPYIVWILIYLALSLSFKSLGVLLNDKPVEELWEYLRDNVNLHTFWTGPILVPLWFVRDLMVTVLFSPLIYFMVKRLKMLGVMVLALAYLSEVWPQVSGFSVTAFFWFSAGAYYSVNGKNMIENIIQYKVPATVMAFCLLIPQVWMNGNKGDGVSPIVMGEILMRLYCMSAVVAVMGIAATLIAKRRVKVRPMLAKASFFVFLVHPFVLVITGHISNRLPENSYPLLIVWYLINPFFVTLISLALYQLLNTYTPRLLPLLTGGRR